tara:strand:+ start:350 stop:751 length:402 start_codon:yes stop_codon:yes gene_type:complete
MTEQSRRFDPDHECVACKGTGWIEVGSGWGASNEPCVCVGVPVGTPEYRRRGHEAFSHFASIAQILDDCFAAGVQVYCIRMKRQDRDNLIRQRTKKRRRDTLPGREASVCGVPVVIDEGLKAKFIVDTEEPQR